MSPLFIILVNLTMTYLVKKLEQIILNGFYILESFKKETSPLGTHLQNNYGHDVQIDVYHLSTHVIYM